MEDRNSPLNIMEIPSPEDTGMEMDSFSTHSQFFFNDHFPRRKRLSFDPSELEAINQKKKELVNQLLNNYTEIMELSDDPTDKRHRRRSKSDSAEGTNRCCNKLDCGVCQKGAVSLPTAAGWREIVIVMFNALQEKNNHKSDWIYWDEDTFQFIEQHWDLLCGGVKVQQSGWRKQLLDTLSHNKKYFENGKQFFGKTGYWRLKKLAPDTETDSGKETPDEMPSPYNSEPTVVNQEPAPLGPLPDMSKITNEIIHRCPPNASFVDITREILEVRSEIFMLNKQTVDTNDQKLSNVVSVTDQALQSDKECVDELQSVKNLLLQSDWTNFVNISCMLNDVEQCNQSLSLMEGL